MVPKCKFSETTPILMLTPHDEEMKVICFCLYGRSKNWKPELPTPTANDAVLTQSWIGNKYKGPCVLGLKRDTLVPSPFSWLWWRRKKATGTATGLVALPLEKHPCCTLGHLWWNYIILPLIRTKMPIWLFVLPLRESTQSSQFWMIR